MADLLNVLHDHDYFTVTTELNSSCVTETPRLDENVLLSATHSDHDETAIHNDGCNIKKKFSKKDQHAAWQEKRKSKIENAKIKHPFRNIPCPEICKNKCNINILVDQRQQIWSDFWVMDYTSRRRYLGNCITVSPVKRRTTTDLINNFKRNESRYFYLPAGPKKDKIRVCRSMFLNTFGYSNDSILTALYKNLRNCDSPCLSTVKENRGNKTGVSNLNIDKTSIINHIKMYNPCSSHYRRHNTPNIMFLPRELTVKSMYEDFCLRYGKLFSQETYRGVLKELNISLKSPISDKCEDCTNYANQIENSIDENEIEELTTKLEHEAVAGRKAENIADSILSIMREERDALNFIFWADNCTGQNKNWVLFTTLISTLNSKHNNSIESVTIKYLTKGHTHMSADGVHGNIEKKFKQVRNIYDYDDLKNKIKESRTNLNIIDQTHFFNWSSKKRSTTIKNDPIKGFKLSSLVMVTFFKGSTKMEYYTNFDEAPKELDFLQKKFLKTIIDYEPDKIIEPRGINIEKKNEIVKKLLPLMPNNRKHFWTTLPVSLTSEDLVSEIGLSDTFINECAE